MSIIVQILGNGKKFYGNLIKIAKKPKAAGFSATALYGTSPWNTQNIDFSVFNAPGGDNPMISHHFLLFSQSGGRQMPE